MILAAYGLVDSSPLQVSEIFRSLNMSHNLVGGFGRTMHLTIDGLCVEQPVWPVVIDRVKAVKKVSVPRDRLVYFVCDGRAALAASNLSQILWPEHRENGLKTGIRDALMASNRLTGDWILQLDEPSIDDYVSLAVRPSFLNRVQGVLYRIQPYTRRKEVQKQCIAYLAGALPFAPLKRYLKANLKLAELLSWMDSERAINLREAVAAARKTGVEMAAREYQCETFEILYIIKSYEQNRDRHPVSP